MNDQERWVVDQAAYYHRVHKSTIVNWIKAGHFSARKIANRWTLDPDEVRSFAQPRRLVPVMDHERIAKRRLAGATLQEIADDYAVTRERIRQIVKEYDPTIPAQVKSERKRTHSLRLRADLDAQLREQMQEALDFDLKCVVCGAWVLRLNRGKTGMNVTCSPEHAEAWPILRTFDETDEHRRHVARTILRNPEKHSESKVRWAQRMLSDNPPPPDRRFFHEGSQRAELIRKYRPEQFQAIVDALPDDRQTKQAYGDM